VNGVRFCWVRNQQSTHFIPLTYTLDSIGSVFDRGWCRDGKCTHAISTKVNIGAEVDAAAQRCRRFLCVRIEQRSEETDWLVETTHTRSRLDGVGGVKIDRGDDFTVPAEVGLPVSTSNQTGRHSCSEVEDRNSSEGDS
jgi:hypothetical protein